MDEITVQKEPNGVYQVKIGIGEVKVYNDVSLLIYRRCECKDTIDQKDQLILGIDSPAMVESLCKNHWQIKDIALLEYDDAKTLHIEVYI